MHSPLIAQFSFKGQLLCAVSRMHSRHNRGTGGIVEIAGHFFFCADSGTLVGFAGQSRGMQDSW